MALRPSFCQECSGTGKTFSGGARFRAGEAPPERVFVKNASGQAKPFGVVPVFALGKLHPDGFSSKSHRNGENLSGWCPLSRWGSATRAGFRQNHIGAAKTFSVGARFCAGGSDKHLFAPRSPPRNPHARKCVRVTMRTAKPVETFKNYRLFLLCQVAVPLLPHDGAFCLPVFCLAKKSSKLFCCNFVRSGAYFSLSDIYKIWRSRV